MKLREVANVTKGTYLLESESNKKTKLYKELTMMSLEPIACLDERKVININLDKEINSKYLTKSGDVIVSLYSPMIAAYVENGQEGYVVPHYMAIVRMKSYVKLDSRFIVHFINSSRGRRALQKASKSLASASPTSLPLVLLNEVELLSETNQLMERL